MRLVRTVQVLAAAAYMAALPLLIVTAPVRWLASDVAVYERGFRAHDSAARTELPLAELDRAARDIIDYFENDARDLRIVVTVNGVEEALFNDREVAHMRDVKQLMRALYRVNEVALVVVLGYIALAVVWAGERSVRGLAKLSLGGLAAGSVVIGSIAVFALTGFDQAWTTFHEVVFRNDLWRLDPDTDRLIQMFPEAFWQETTYLAGGLMAVEALAVLALCAGYLARTRGEVRSIRGRAGARAPSAAPPGG
jgi:integral membrane protein (TIGR01906 family)